MSKNKEALKENTSLLLMKAYSLAQNKLKKYNKESLNGSGIITEDHIKAVLLSLQKELGNNPNITEAEESWNKALEHYKDTETHAWVVSTFQNMLLLHGRTISQGMERRWFSFTPKGEYCLPSMFEIDPKQVLKEFIEILEKI